MPATIAIPAILGAAGVGASLFGASKAAGAAKSAAQQQQQAITQAQGIAKDAWGQQQQVMSPYVQAGQQALSNLMANYGHMTPQSTANNISGFMNQARMNPYGIPFAQTQGQPQGQPAQGPPPQGGPQPWQQMPQGPGQGPGGGGMVTVSDDSGATRQVPQAHAQMYAQRGFKVMG